MATMITAKEFVDKYDNEFIEAGGSPNALNQCVDVINKFFEEVLGIQKILGTNAVDFPSKVSSDFEWIPNDEKSDIPKPFDIPIWGKPVGKYTYNGKTYYAGHIAFALEGCTEDKLICFGQNWPLGSNAHKQEHNYTNVLGWLRYKHLIQTQPTTKPEVPEAVYKFLYVENKFSEGDIREGMEAFRRGDVKQLQKDLADQKKTYEGRIDTVISECNDQLKKLSINMITRAECNTKVEEAVSRALIVPNGKIESMQIELDRLAEVEKKYQELVEKGIRLFSIGGKDIFIGLIETKKVRDLADSGE